MNVYGAIVDHIEPSHVKKVLVPIPTKKSVLNRIGQSVIEGIEMQESAYRLLEKSRKALSKAIDTGDEDSFDLQLAQSRLLDVAANPDDLLRGDNLEERKVCT